MHIKKQENGTKDCCPALLSKMEHFALEREWLEDVFYSGFYMAGL
jgi:hypothetical protein